MTTVRVRLTLIYSGLFLLTSVVLLVTVNLLLRHALRSRIVVLPEAPDAPVRGDLVDRPPPLPDLVDEVINYQWGVTALTVGVLALVSVIVGWLVAGRILRPIHRITANVSATSSSPSGVCTPPASRAPGSDCRSSRRSRRHTGPTYG